MIKFALHFDVVVADVGTSRFDNALCDIADLFPGHWSTAASISRALAASSIFSGPVFLRNSLPVVSCSFGVCATTNDMPAQTAATASCGVIPISSMDHEHTSISARARFL